MAKRTDQSNQMPKRSFRAAALLLEPSMIAIACHLARIAAEADYKSFSLNGQIPYTDLHQKGGPS
jgi:hypothetical protein